MTLLKTELKKMLRDSLSYVALIFLIPYLFFGLKLNNGVIDFPQAYPGQQIALWWAGLLGYRYFVTWHKKTAFDWMRLERKERTITLVGFAAHTLLFVFLGIIIFVVAKISQNPAGAFPWFNRDVPLFILYYYVFPMMISFLVGILVAIFAKGPLGYFVTLIVLFLMGPFGFDLLGTIGQFFPKGLQELLFQPLRLGYPLATKSVNAFYGMETGLRVFMLRVGLIGVCLLLIWCFGQLLEKRKLAFPIFIGTAFLFALSFVGIMNTSSAQMSGLGEVQRMETENAYYADTESDFSTTFGQWKTLELHLKTKKDLSVNLTGDFEVTESTQDPKFSLYHALRMKEVHVNGTEVSFTQEGDNIFLNDVEFIEGEVIHLEMRYSGMTPYPYFADAKAMYLPSYFNWYPVAYAGNLFRGNPFLALPQESQPVAYSVQVDTNNPVWTNVQESGISDTGLCVISGFVTQEVRDNLDLVYAQTRYLEGGISFVKDTDQKLQEIADYLGEEYTPIRAVAVIPESSQTIGYYAGLMQKNGDTAYLSDALPYENYIEDEQWQSEMYLDRVFTFVSGNTNFMRQDAALQEDFMEALFYAKTGRGNINDSEISQFLDTASEDDIQTFFREWYTLLSSQRLITQDDVNELR